MLQLHSVAFIANFVGMDMVCILGPLCAALWVWMLVEAITKEPKEGNDRLIWVLVILLGGILGAVIYFFARRPERIRKHNNL